MTPERLAEIKARCEQATAGPWELCVCGCLQIMSKPADCLIADLRAHEAWCSKEGFPMACSGPANAAFVAHTRTDLPDLLTHVDDLTARLGEVEGERDALDEACRAHVVYERQAEQRAERAERALAAAETRVKGLEQALVIAAIPLEALRAAECDAAATSLTRELQDEIVHATDLIHQRLAATNGTAAGRDADAAS